MAMMVRSQTRPFSYDSLIHMNFFSLKRYSRKELKIWKEDDSSPKLNKHYVMAKRALILIF